MSSELPRLRLIDNDGKQVAALSLRPDHPEAGPFEIGIEEALEYGEASVQLVEGATYEYRLDSLSFRLKELPGIVRRSVYIDSHDQGRITPGLNIGRLRLYAEATTDPNLTACAEVEIRPNKVGYRTDYRYMLEAITNHCTDLLLQFRSPANQTVLPDDSRDPDTICQRFAFVKSLITSRRFQDAVQRVTALPHSQWQKEIHDAPIGRVRPTAGIARQVANGKPRMPLPSTHPVRDRIPSVPCRVNVPLSAETVDTAENRFVKHALTTFQAFVTKVKGELLKAGRQSDARFVSEAEAIENQLGEILSRGFFRDVSEPQMLPLGSPVLQRKGGYREVLTAWLQFDMAARLCWSGGDGVYGAGKRDVATLYEYWLFFRLLEVVAAIFDLDEPRATTLIEETSDGFGLKLKSGKHIALFGNYSPPEGRELRVRFSFNRTFSRRGVNCDWNFPAPGSWTERMRPDYTLTLWPSDFSEEEAEEQEIIVHVHFDAKYRVNRLAEIFGEPDESFSDNNALEEDAAAEKITEREGNYKRVDLLKMHAYKDAIRRTAGAYVLYPGNQAKNWRGFHEIVPGLGAFGIRPTEDNDDGTAALRTFILEVVNHVCDRATRREQETYHRYRIQDPNSGGPSVVRERLAEYDATGRRTRPPQETNVLIAWFVDDRQLGWSEENGLIVLRLTTKRGAISLIPENVATSYILMHTEGLRAAEGLFAPITDRDGRVHPPEVVPADTLMTSYGYPLPTHSDYYLVYHVERDAQFEGTDWDIAKLLKMKGKRGRQSPIPFNATLDEVMNCAKIP